MSRLMKATNNRLLLYRVLGPSSVEVTAAKQKEQRRLDLDKVSQK